MAYGAPRIMDEHRRRRVFHRRQESLPRPAPSLPAVKLHPTKVSDRRSGGGTDQWSVVVRSGVDWDAPTSWSSAALVLPLRKTRGKPDAASAPPEPDAVLQPTNRPVGI